MIRESRLRKGLLTIDGLPFATQATNVQLVPSTDEEGDTLEVLSGDLITPDDVTTWELRVTSIQDFDHPDGFQAFALTNRGEEVPFSWRPNETGVTFSGTVKVRPLTIGGDVNSRLTVDVVWPLKGDPTPSYAAGEPTGTDAATFGAMEFGEGEFGA